MNECNCAEVEVKDGDMKKIQELLDQGKKVIFYAENGEKMQEALKTKKIAFLNANIKLIEENKNGYDAICGCGKKANLKVLLYR